jgi:DNA-binding NarL/FixJ family response regulator
MTRRLAPVREPADAVPYAPGSVVPVCVCCADPISRAGVLSQLRSRPEVRVLDDDRLAAARVAVVVAEKVDDATVATLRRLRGQVGRLVLVAGTLDDAALVQAAEAGVAGLLRREDAEPEVLVHTIERVAAGHGELPSDLLGRLLDQVGRLQRQVLAPRGLVFAGLTDREKQVLQLCADGHDTAAIARRLCYSERTVKNVLHDLTVRLGLRNRTHAVAYALREGLI